MDFISGSFLSTKIFIYSVIIAVGIVGVIGDVAVYQWARSSRIEWWILSAIIWIGAATLFGLVLRQGYFTFGTAVILALLVHSISALLIDFFYYRVTLSHISLLGVTFALIALYLIEAGRTTGS